MVKNTNREGLIYAREKLGVAVWKLATGIGDIKSRLSNAYIELAIIQEGDLPIDLVDDWKEKYRGVGLSGWDFDELDMWIETIEDKDRRDRLMGIVEVFKGH